MNETPKKSESAMPDDDQYEQWLENHPKKIIAPESLRECGPEIEELEKLLELFELQYSLEKLLSITRLTVEEARKHPFREPARIALYAIVEKLNALKGETNITLARYGELEEKYRVLSRAVGIINANNMVDHSSYPHDKY